jgi:hypothetical protein
MVISSMFPQAGVFGFLGGVLSPDRCSASGKYKESYREPPNPAEFIDKG